MPKNFKVWMMPVYSKEIYAETEEEAINIAAGLAIENFHEHTDMCEITAEINEETQNA